MSSINEIKTPESMIRYSYENGTELRRGPWTLEEDNLLIQYITCHGEGKWNSLAKFAGLNRTGKSCRLRWLNYLKPDIKRGDLTPHEQILILELHSKLGNRWSKIAQHLPGRTDNEIKNYWRTRVQKQARHLKIDSNSNKFLETIRMYWMPRLMEKIEQNHSSSSQEETRDDNFTAPFNRASCLPSPGHKSGDEVNISNSNLSLNIPDEILEILTPETYSKIFRTNSRDQFGDDIYHVDIPSYDIQEFGFEETPIPDFHVAGIDWFGKEGTESIFWNNDELWSLIREAN